MIRIEAIIPKGCKWDPCRDTPWHGPGEPSIRNGYQPKMIRAKVRLS